MPGRFLGRKYSRGIFAPDLMRFEVAPGDYRLAVQLVDRTSGKWGVYLQDLNVPDYVDSLTISDLQLCWNITETTREGKFKKENLWVVPMPSRSYRQDTNIHIYYELYNLHRDAFGRNRYRVSYSIQRDARLGKGFFGALSSLVRRIVAAGAEEVVVSYERNGDDATEAIYFELDAALSQTRLQPHPGIRDRPEQLTGRHSHGHLPRRKIKKGPEGPYR